MNKSASKQIYANRGFWYVRYKDPISQKWKAISTKLRSTRRNFEHALKIRDEFYIELKKHEEIEFRQGDIRYAFSHFKEINANKSESTLETYDIFYSYLIQKVKEDTPCHTINKKIAEEFLLWLNKLKNIQQNTKYGIQKNFLKFLRFMFEYEYIPKIFILNRDVKIRAKVNEPLIFTETDRKTIINGLSTDRDISKLHTKHKDDKVYKKNRSSTPYVKNGNFRTMVMVLMYTGLRPSDIINITADQIDLEKMEIKFYSSKIDKWFVRPIHKALKEVLSLRIDEVKIGRIFEYDEVKNMGKAFSRYLEVINLSGKGYNLRTFRKDFISRCQESGISIATTALLVGHSNIKTTMTYYTKLSSQHLTEELSKLK